MANYGSEDSPGYIKLSYVTSSIYLGGINPTTFQFKIETTLNDHPTGRIKNTWEMIDSFQQYNLEKQPLSADTTATSAALLAPTTPLPKQPFSGTPCAFCISRFGADRVFHVEKNCRTLKRTAAASVIAAAAATAATIPSIAPQLVARGKNAASAKLAAALALVAAREDRDLAAAHALIAASSEKDGYDSFLAISDGPPPPPPPLLFPVIFPKDTALPILCGAETTFGNFNIDAAAYIACTPNSWYYDNGASYSTVNSLDVLADVHPIPPFPIGGIGSGVVVTHSGSLPFLPLAISKAYYAPVMKVNLISLGSIVANGGKYSGAASFLTVSGPDGVVIDKVKLAKNNLSPVSSSLIISKPAAYPAITHHFSAEERSRSAEAEQLHLFLDHPSDDVLCEALTNGAFPRCTLTSRDVRNNRVIRGNCPQCLAGKLCQKPMPSSSTPPAHSVDEKSGRFDVIPTKPKVLMIFISV